MKYSKESSSARGYNHRWRKARAQFLQLHPLCRYCEQMGKIQPAEVVDHRVPHKGDQALFWDHDNWQPLCKTCHDAVKQAEERNGRIMGCGVDGEPLAGWLVE